MFLVTTPNNKTTKIFKHLKNKNIFHFLDKSKFTNVTYTSLPMINERKTNAIHFETFVSSIFVFYCPLEHNCFYKINCIAC